ncbi:MAG TPA: DUF5666 domain-containing protein [Methylocella sp.]
MTGSGKDVTRVSLSLFMSLAFLAVTSGTIAQTRSNDPGIGGTGYQPGEGNGIGGTGQPFGRSPGIGGTGIIGTITGFGSILVNGFEIDYAPDQLVSSDEGTSLHPDALRIGQVVEVEADGDGQRVRARSIAVRHEVAGRIESIDRESGSLVVLGQTVSADKGIVADQKGPGSRSLSDLAVGDSIDVSGLRRDDGVIVASRVDRLATGRSALIRGTVTAVDDAGFTVGQLRVTAPPNHQLTRPVVGAEVAVMGAMAQGSFSPRRIEIAPRAPFAGRIKRLSVEGYVGHGRSGALSVGGVVLGGAKGGAQAQFGNRVIINGGMDEHRHLIPTTVRPSHVNLQRRNGPGDMNPPARQLPSFQNRPSNRQVAPGSEPRRQVGPPWRPHQGWRWKPNRPHGRVWR